MIRPSKQTATRFACKWVPLYAEMFHLLYDAGGRVQMIGRYAGIRQNLGNYVQLYDNEHKPGNAIMLGLMGNDSFREFNVETASWSDQQKLEFVEEACSKEVEEQIDRHLSDLPCTEREWEEQEKLIQAMSDEERAEHTKRGGYFMSGFFAQFFNTLALMTHGAKLTALVPQATQGDDDAFLKAVQVDRLLLTHHPYFIQRKQRAQDQGETEFLRALAYRESNPNLKGKIRYPGLFMLFAILDSLRWLDDLTHNEILDICDSCGLDRYQNRIEDVSYLTKRLRDYRKFQNTGGLSMH